MTPSVKKYVRKPRNFLSLKLYLQNQRNPQKSRIKMS